MSRPTSLRRRPLVLVGALISGLFFLWPYVVMFLTSLKPTNELFSTPITLFPRHWTWSNYINVWHFAPIAGYLRTTLIIAGTSTVIVIFVAVPAAYATARMRFRGRKAFLGMILLTQMLAPVALLVGLYRQFILMGLIDTVFSLILTNAAFNLAFAVWILNGYFVSIPLEIEEAAMIDGCSRFRILRSVVLPLAMPGMVTAIIFTFIAGWNEYVMALTLINTPSKWPITLGITSFMGRFNIDYQYLFAASLISIVPVVILFALIEKRLVQGLTAGSIK
jgi:multiple sugar transport system permease protein